MEYITWVAKSTISAFVLIRPSSLFSDCRISLCHAYKHVLIFGWRHSSIWRNSWRSWYSLMFCHDITQLWQDRHIRNKNYRWTSYANLWHQFDNINATWFTFRILSHLSISDKGKSTRRHCRPMLHQWHFPIHHCGRTTSSRYNRPFLRPTRKLSLTDLHKQHVFHLRNHFFGLTGKHCSYRHRTLIRY